MKKLILIFLGIIISFPILWLVFWTVIMRIPDDYYGLIKVNNTPYFIVRETQMKSWLCKDIGHEQYLKIVDNSSIKDVYWNDSILVAICIEDHKINKDSICYIVNLKNDKSEVVDKNRVLLDSGFKNMSYIHVPYY